MDDANEVAGRPQPSTTESTHGEMHSTQRCPHCGAASARWLLTTNVKNAASEPYAVVECVHCAQRYTSPAPTEAELTAIYDAEYYAGCTPQSRGLGLVRAAVRWSILRERMRMLGRRAPGRILDVSCGNGDFLAAVKQRGWDVVGTEFSESAAGLVRSRGITVATEADALTSFPDGHFDVVTMWHVLEHLPRPQSELAEIRRILRQDGLLIIEAPNSASWTFRLCGADWDPLKIPQHLLHFTPTTLNRLLGDCGFLPVRRQNYHLWDFTFDCYSFLGRSRRGGAGDVRPPGLRPSFGGKALRLGLNVAVAGLSLPYSLLSTALSGHGSVVTIIYRKSDSRT